MRTFHTSHHPRFWAVALGAILAVGTAGCQSTGGAGGVVGQGGINVGPTALASTTPATAPESDAAIQPILADLRAAKAQHDVRAFQQFRHQLAQHIGASAIEEADAAYRHVLADLMVADAIHDAPARARFRLQLHALCDPAGLTSAIESCESDIAAYGG
jgi:hypothetical protein